jgi:hypothetical protein
LDLQNEGKKLVLEIKTVVNFCNNLGYCPFDGIEEIKK